MIAIIDYGMGNLFSVSKALERLGEPYLITNKKDEILLADGVIVPGVGAISDAMRLLNETGIADVLRDYAASGKPILGICLGMQLLFEASEENGGCRGLGLLPGTVVKIPGVTTQGEMYKVPHMGWNLLQLRRQSPILKDVEEGFAYFVHSYYVTTETDEIILADSLYDVCVPAVVGKNNVFGTQFHPEKSSMTGMKILENFTVLVSEGVSVK
ncbi:imidazole glycerol phosphate synthase subunit HisH [Cytobacillus kochii]